MTTIASASGYTTWATRTTPPAVTSYGGNSDGGASPTSCVSARGSDRQAEEHEAAGQEEKACVVMSLQPSARGLGDRQLAIREGDHAEHERARGLRSRSCAVEEDGGRGAESDRNQDGQVIPGPTRRGFVPAGGIRATPSSLPSTKCPSGDRSSWSGHSGEVARLSPVGWASQGEPNYAYAPAMR